MRTLTIALAVTAVGVLPASASAHHGATVLHGQFKLVPPSVDSVARNYGRAMLVDGRRRDVLRVGVQRLRPHTRYLYRLRQGRVACRPDAPGYEVPGWRYRARGVLATDRLGTARGIAVSRTFQVQRGVAYYVGVYSLANSSGAVGRLVLCAELRARPIAHRPTDDREPDGGAPPRDPGTPDAPERPDAPPDTGEKDRPERPDPPATDRTPRPDPPATDRAPEPDPPTDRTRGRG